MSSLAFDETLLDRFENTIKALRNILPHLHQSNFLSIVLSKIAHNLQLMYWDYIRQRDFCVDRRYSQVAVFSLNQPGVNWTKQPGRPKFDMSEDTLNVIGMK